MSAARSRGTTRVVRSLTAILVGKVVLTAGSLLLVPLYLTHWSTPLYGEWLAISAAVAYLSTLDLGMNMGAVNRLTQAYARGEAAEYQGVQRAGLTFYLGIAVCGTLFVAVVASAVPIRNHLGLVEMTSRESALTIFILACLVLWAMPSGFITATYRSVGDMATSQWIGNAQQLLVVMATAAALLLGSGPIGIAYSQLGILATVTAFTVWHLRRRDSSLVLSLGRWRKGVLQGLLRPSLFFVLAIAANAITLQGSVIVVSVALGGGAVAMFVTLRTLVNTIRQLVNTVVISVWPELTRLDARGDLGTLRSVHSIVVVATSAVCIAFGAALWWEGAEVISVWTRRALTADLLTLRLLLSFLVFQSPIIVAFVFVAASNRHARVSVALVISSAVGLTLAALLVRRFGTAGIVAGLMVGDLVVCSHFVVREACGLVGERYGAFAWRLWSNLILVAAIAVFGGWLAHVAAGGHYVVRWLFVGLVTSAVTAIATWTFWLTRGDRELLGRQLRPVRAIMAGARV